MGSSSSQPLPITQVTRNAISVTGNTPVSCRERFWLFLGLVSFLCALGIFTESQFYAYTIGIHGTYAHIIYYVVGVTLSSAIQVLLIQPDKCKNFLEVYEQWFILKSCGGYLFMFTVCFLSSGTGLPYLGLSSDGTSPSPAVAPYRSQAFSEIAGLLASSLLTVNALSICALLKPAEHNAFFEVAAALTLESAMALLYKYPFVAVAAAAFIMAMTLLKNSPCLDQVVKANDDRADGERPADGRRHAGDKAADNKRHKANGKHDKAADGKRDKADDKCDKAVDGKRDNVDDKRDKAADGKRDNIDGKRDKVADGKRDKADDKCDKAVDGKRDNVDGKRDKAVDGKRDKAADGKRDKAADKRDKAADGKRDKANDKCDKAVDGKRDKAVDGKRDNVDDKRDKAANGKRDKAADGKRDNVDDKRNKAADGKRDKADDKRDKAADGKRDKAADGKRNKAAVAGE